MQKIAIGSRFPLPKLFVQVYDRSLQQFRRGGYGAITKTLLVLKLTILLLTAALLNVHANSKAQTVTLSGKDLTLQQVFAAIEKQTDYVAFYNVGMLANTKPVTLTVYSMPLKDLLNTVLKEQPLDYSIEGKTIILSRKPLHIPNVNPGTPVAPSFQLFTPPVSGQVFNSEGQPLAGVTVVYNGGKKGTTTGNDGFFRITLSEGDIMEFTSIGYLPVSIRYDGKVFKQVSTNKKQANDGKTSKLVDGSYEKLTVMLARSSSPLDEVQITAYGKTSNRLATGNIGTIKAADIEKQPVFTVMEAIIGRVPGVEVNPFSGNPAAPVSVIIRGKNTLNEGAITDPLYVIDGMPLSNLNASPTQANTPTSMGAVQAGRTHTQGENPLLSINPRDVESISVLKDADATAIYGSRGANGVIIITTKKGKPGQSSFNVSVRNGITMVQRFPRMLNTKEYLDMRREAFMNDGIIPDADNAPDLVTWDTTKYTDWARELLGTGITNDVNASLSGGTGQSTYMFSANYRAAKLYNSNGHNRSGSFMSNFGHTSNNQKLKLGISTNLSLSDVMSLITIPLDGLVPNSPDIYDKKGDFNFAPYRYGGGGGTKFPFTQLRKPSESKSFSLLSVVKLDYELFEGLNFSVNGGYQYSSNRNHSFEPEASIDPLYFIYSSATYGMSVVNSWQAESQLAYSTFVGKGKLNVQLLSTLQKNHTQGETIFALGFPNDAMMKSYNNAMPGGIFNVDGVRERKYLAGSAIINYNWNNKYVINLNGRRDGSSRFGPGKQFGNFWSVGLAWIASDEKWMEALLPSWVSFLKFRGSFGINGSDNIGDYEYLSRWSKSGSANGEQMPAYGGITPFHVIYPLKQKYQWESTRKTEVAADLGFWDGRLNLGIAWYSNSTKDQLRNQELPGYTGFFSSVTNWPAHLRNTGIELFASANVISSKDWKLGLAFNIGRNQNKLVDFPNIESSSQKGRYRIGYSTSARFLLRYTGVDPMTGNVTFEDHNKDGKVSRGDGTIAPTDPADDRYIDIDINPKFSGGASIQLGYKSLSLSTSFSFIKQYRQDPYLTTPVGGMRNLLYSGELMNNRWRQPGDKAKYPRFSTMNEVDFLFLSLSDAYYVNGSYLRMTNLAFTWQLPATWLKKVAMKNAHLSLQMQNLFTITPYKGLSPDLQNLNVLPTPRIITTYLSFTF